MQPQSHKADYNEINVQIRSTGDERNLRDDVANEVKRHNDECSPRNVSLLAGAVLTGLAVFDLASKN